MALRATFLIDRDGKVDDNDLSIVLTNWGVGTDWTTGNFKGSDTMRIARAIAISATALISSSPVFAQNAGSSYHVTKRIAAGGEGGWDYLVADAQNRRLYVTRGSHIEVKGTVQKVRTLGFEGAGTIALAIAEPRVELDTLFWNAGWQAVETELFRQRVDAARLTVNDAAVGKQQQNTGMVESRRRCQQHQRLPQGHRRLDGHRFGLE